MEPNAVKRLFARWSRNRDVRSWASGLVGERITGRRLAKLGSQWKVLHAVQWASGSDIDHLAVGPTGVFAINSKRHKGKEIWYGDRAITVNRVPTRHIAISQGEAQRIARVLTRHCGFSVAVKPVIAVVHVAKLTVKNAAPPVLVVEEVDLPRRLAGMSPVLSCDQVARIYEVARDARTWARG
ncbi:nuclease-related domain-containing protein [Streptomyces platensis]|uniref:nuclease-related domain-containing protein n=1 Tax=Streptomyces platensis TaxID=58346 RepID=UPI001FCB49ED|nr:nuclease-related domain-containing protein [Streptomyces platensis]